LAESRFSPKLHLFRKILTHNNSSAQAVTTALTMSAIKIVFINYYLV